MTDIPDDVMQAAREFAADIAQKIGWFDIADCYVQGKEDNSVFVQAAVYTIFSERAASKSLERVAWIAARDAAAGACRNKAKEFQARTTRSISLLAVFQSGLHAANARKPSAPLSHQPSSGRILCRYWPIKASDLTMTPPSPISASACLQSMRC